MTNQLRIEVCCGSAEDAVLAYEAGADRVELNFALEAGGLTPSLGTLHTALRRVKIPVVCMVRPRAGGFCYSDLEFASMLDDARRLMDAGAAGLAFGILREDGRLDEQRCAKMISAAGGGEMVFHRAFDVMHGQPEADIEDLIRLGFCRVLTGGRAATAPQGTQVLLRCVEQAGERLQVLAGGGVRLHNAENLLLESGVRQVHFTCHKAAYDRSAAGAAVSFDAPGAEPFAVRIVDVDVLRKLINDMKRLPLREMQAKNKIM